MDDYTDLIAMKKTRKKPRDGDVFALQPAPGMYYFGKVIQARTESIYSMLDGWTLIYIYKYRSASKDMPPGLEDEELLFAPVVVNHQPWLKGYFETVGNVAVSEKEKNLDYVFWDVAREIYVDINGQPVDRKPKYAATFGLGSYGYIGRAVQGILREEAGKERP